MQVIDKAGTIRRNGNNVEVLHHGEWIHVGIMKYGQFVPQFQSEQNKGLLLALQGRASLAIASGRTKSIVGFIRRILS